MAVTCSRYVQAISACPKCGRKGYLIVRYRKRESVWTGPYFEVRHWLFDRAGYRKLREQGYSTDQIMHEIPTTRYFKQKGTCYFGSSYPGKIVRPIRGPSDPALRECFKRLKRRSNPSPPSNPRSYRPNKARTFLTLEQAQQIRQLHHEQHKTQTHLAKSFNVSQSQISFILNGKILKEGQ